MTRATIAGGAATIVLSLLAVVVCYRALEPDVDPATETAPANTPSTATAAAHRSFLYGRVTTHDGATYEGRLRWGGDEEAFWGDYFNGVKDENRWAAHAPPEQLEERRPFEIFGVQIAQREPTPAKGGWALAFARSAMAGDLGLDLNLGDSADLADLGPDVALFSESTGRFLVTVAREDAERFAACFEGLPCRRVGSVTRETRLRVRGKRRVWLDVAVDRLRSAFQETLADA